jgi:endonuclease V-like protein UPF0215 family
MFKSQFISVAKKMITKGMIIKGVYSITNQVSTSVTHFVDRFVECVFLSGITHAIDF